MCGHCDLVITDERHIKKLLLRPQHSEGPSYRGLEVVPLEEKLVCHPDLLSTRGEDQITTGLTSTVPSEEI